MSTTTKKDRPDEITEPEIVKREFAFLWPVPAAGLQWRDDFFPVELRHRRRDDDHGPGPWLVPVSSVEWRQRAPLDQTRLHRKFAALKTGDAIELFASTHGLLGHSAHGVLGAPAGLVEWRAESHGRWVHEIEAMRAVLGQWDMVRTREPGKGRVDPHRMQVYRTVNDKLEGRFSSVAHPARGGEILHWPDCLLSALYLLLQFELARRPARSVRCKLETCGRVLEGFTTRKEFCSPSHGNLFRYHHRKAEQLAEP